MKLLKGTLLFHASGEPEVASIQNTDELRTSGDGVFWTSRDSAIAQAYIPVSGSTIYFHTRNLLDPNCNGDKSAITWLQKKVGLEFAEVQWRGSMVDSYRVVAHPFADEPQWEDRQRKLCDLFIATLRGMGYEPENQDTPEYLGWKVKTQYRDTPEGAVWEMKNADWRLPGRLLILRLNQDVEVQALTGSSEGSLLEPEHLMHSRFRNRFAAGVQAISINDFAQTDDMGNFGHMSIGFQHPGNLLTLVANIPAIHPTSFQEAYRENDYGSAEFKAWATLPKPTWGECLEQARRVEFGPPLFPLNSKDARPTARKLAGVGAFGTSA